MACTVHLPSTELRPVVEAILHYVLAHPEAKDSSVGIRDCWLRDAPPASVDEVSGALAYLEAHGCIAARPIAVGHDPLYSVPTGRTGKMHAILSALTSRTGSGRGDG